MRTPTSPPLTPRRLAQQPPILEVPARVGTLPGILRARTLATQDATSITLRAQRIDNLLVNAKREVIGVLEKEALTTLVDHHDAGISETLRSSSPVTCSGRPDVDATDGDFTVHLVLEDFASKHLCQLRAAADRCDVSAFEKQLEKASVHFGGGPREKPPEGLIRALLLQVTSCITELEAALKPLLSAHLEKFSEQLAAPRQQGTDAEPDALSNRAMPRCLPAFQRAAEKGNARAYLAALAELRRHLLPAVTFSSEVGVRTMQAQV